MNDKIKVQKQTAQQNELGKAISELSEVARFVETHQEKISDKHWIALLNLKQQEFADKNPKPQPEVKKEMEDFMREQRYSEELVQKAIKLLEFLYLPTKLHEVYVSLNLSEKASKQFSADDLLDTAVQTILPTVDATYLIKWLEKLDSKNSSLLNKSNFKNTMIRPFGMYFVTLQIAINADFNEKSQHIKSLVELMNKNYSDLHQNFVKQGPNIRKLFSDDIEPDANFSIAARFMQQEDQFNPISICIEYNVQCLNLYRAYLREKIKSECEAHGLKVSEDIRDYYKAQKAKKLGDVEFCLTYEKLQKTEEMLKILKNSKQKPQGRLNKFEKEFVSYEKLLNKNSDSKTKTFIKCIASVLGLLFSSAFGFVPYKYIHQSLWGTRGKKVTEQIRSVNQERNTPRKSS